MIAVSLENSLTTDVYPISACALDDQQILMLDAEGRIYMADLENKSSELFFETSIGGNQLSISPNKSRLACVGPEGYVLIESPSGKLIEQRRGAWSSVARWHESGEKLLITFAKKICVIDINGVPLFESEDFSSTVTDACWIGDRIAVASYGGVSVSRADTNSFIRREFVGSLLCLAASPKGDWIVSGNQDASLQVYKVSDDTRLEMQGFPRKITISNFNIDGKWLANNGADEVTVWSFAGKGPKGRSPVILAKHVGGGTAISWNPVQPNLLATGDSIGQLRVWDLKLGLEGKPLIPFQNHEPVSNSPIKAILWNSTGDSITAVHSDGVVCQQGIK